MNSSPPIGELKIALDAGRCAQPTMTGICWRAIENNDPNADEIAALIWTIGPSPPGATRAGSSAHWSGSSMAVAGLRIRWSGTTDSITSMTPCPLARETRRDSARPPPAHLPPATR